jgi:hypothetical protein
MATMSATLDDRWEWVELRRFGSVEATYVKGACRHREIVPVESVFVASALGEAVVAHLCLTCDAQLPEEWRP